MQCLHLPCLKCGITSETSSAEVVTTAKLQLQDTPPIAGLQEEQLADPQLGILLVVANVVLTGALQRYIQEWCRKCAACANKKHNRNSQAPFTKIYPMQTRLLSRSLSVY